MNDVKQTPAKNKGGRPQQPIKQNQFIGVKCSLIEKIVLQQKAKEVNLSLSEYLRESALKGQAVSKKKIVPKEILQFTSTLNHLAANLNQVAKKRNSFEVLNSIEIDELNRVSALVKQLAVDIKNYLL